MIPKSFIQDLLNRLDIVDVVERYVPLKKAGANYVACCPFHNEKSPSFTVSQSKQFYHCFGCGAHGTAIGFVMEHAGMGFVEAVEELARNIGVAVPRETRAPEQAQHKIAPDLYEMMQITTRYYREQLKQSPRAIDYLKRRGLSGEIAARFGIGYAPEGWQNLEAVFPDYRHASLLETGLVVESQPKAASAEANLPEGQVKARSAGRNQNDEGKRYDRFRDRIMFPIANARGQIIGFGGRVLDKGEPKYLNSPETPLFEKGRELYGLYQAQKAIRAARAVLVVEGYMDVVALAQHGIEYAVATLGTATTPYHVQKLLRLSDRVVFCFDGDAAGRKAAWRALENALPQLVDGKFVGFLFLPPEHDPDSFVREHGKEAFERLLREALPLSGYLLRELSAQVDLGTQEGRSAMLQRAKPLLTAIAAPMAGLLLRKELAALAGITQAELEALYGVNPTGAPPRRAVQKAARPAASSLRVLLRCLLFQPELARQLPPDFAVAGAEAAAVAALVEWLRAQAGEATTAAVIQGFQGTAHETLFAAEQAEIMQWGDAFDAAAEFQGVLARLRQAEHKQQLRALEAKPGGWQALDEQEKERYRQLLQRG
ncbi:MAG: DNA primase [Nitrosomonadales bacterium]|nr:DNA primase [Nitrosomonadales bacterium]